ncbi:MAG: hypothetical protein ACK4NH_03745, partial [Gemmobacter sp.]
MKTLFCGLMAATSLTAALPALAQSVEATIAGLPEVLRAQYEGAPQTVTAGPLADFTPKAAPYKWCHSESYQGNPWRVS